MDDGAHRENGRHKPAQGQWLMQHQPSMKHIMGIMAERDAAIQERNLAISEKKAAIAERDLAILQRDTAIAERNNAIIERDNAIAALQYRENNLQAHDPSHVVEAQYDSGDMHLADQVTIAAVAPEPAKAYRAKRAKETKPVASRRTSKSSKKVKQEGEDHNKVVLWKSVPDTGIANDDLNRQVGTSKQHWKDQDLGLNQVSFDETTMPVPVCSCTGVFRPCYKWGNGGWQSSCCTTNLSMYPLPAVPNKKHARVGGRKMSGSAFSKLLSRLAADGYDLSNPVDLKSHWAKHGTNRYITIK